MINNTAICVQKLIQIIFPAWEYFDAVHYTDYMCRGKKDPLRVSFWFPVTSSRRHYLIFSVHSYEQ